VAEPEPEPDPEPGRSAAIVLAGGRSKRMGRAKATLEWHGSTLLRRAVGIVGRAVDGPVIVVRAAGQELPPLPHDVEVITDARDGRGPLQGIASGLERLGDRAQVIFVTGVDTPRLHPAFVRHVLTSLREHDDIALPHAAGFAQPLAAAYRTATVGPRLDDELAHDRLGSATLLARLRVRTLDEAALLADPELAALDPALDSLTNLNEPAEYDAARARPAPRITIRSPTHAGGRPATAATLAQAAAAAGIRLGDAVAITRNGERTPHDPEEPLATGDTIAFESTKVPPPSSP
jgi:molybdopterin-guanine dinucleotide biosynthesis protein A